VFGTLKTSFVGFRVNKHRIHTDEKKVKVVRDWETPKTPTELGGFPRLGWLLQEIRAEVRSQCPSATRPRGQAKTEFKWTKQHRDQFEDLKQALTTAPVLATLDPDGDFILRTDASDTALGGVLAQKQLFEGKLVEWPLGYFSRKLHAAESRYPAYDRELLAISANLELWACYVHGRKRTTI
jgi:hypothetical protein